MVFMFKDNHGCLFDQQEFTEIQEVLQACSPFRDFDKKLIPTYKYFQVKRNTVETINRTKRHPLQLIDISAKVFYDDMRAQEEYMNITSSSISHEMRNPLNSILGQCKIQETKVTELLKLIDRIQHKLSPQELQEARAIQNSFKKSNRIQQTSSKQLLFQVESMLGIAQIRAQRFSKSITSFNVHKAIEEVIDIQQDKAELQGLELRCSVAIKGREFNPETQKLKVHSDRQRLQQVLLLQSNALKFTKQGGSVSLNCTYVPADQNPPIPRMEQARVDEASATEEMIHNLYEATNKPKLVVEVKDTGIGMSPEDQTKLFKLFGKLQQTSQMNTNRVGLGLSICKQIIEQFNGSIFVKSQVNQGTSFFFSFEIEAAEIIDEVRQLDEEFNLNLTERSNHFTSRLVVWRPLSTLNHIQQLQNPDQIQENV